LPELPQIEERVLYYIAQPFPTLVFDGTDKVFEPNSNAYDTVFNQHIQIAKSAAPVYNLTLNASATSSNGTLNINISPADTLYHDSVYAFVAVCEDSANGDLGGIFNYVIRNFYTFPVNLIFPDELDTTITFSHSIPVDKMRGVLFVQDVHSKKVLQAIKKQF
jgi:hypothetical protein